MRRRSHLILAAVLTALAPPASSGLTDPEVPALPADLGGALESFNQATVSNDTETLATLVTDDYMLVNSDASVQDKASYLSDFEVPGFRIDPYVIEQPIYRVRGGAALTGGVLNLGWTQEGRHQGRRLRIAHFWTKQDGRWRIEYTQLTRVPE